MRTKLVEFKNQEDETLRGILTVPDASPKQGAVFLQGFERNATVEKKFRLMADALAGRGMVSFRFDASGCGLSDGDFSKTTLKNRGQELLMAAAVLHNEFGDIKIDFIAHSLGTCPLALVFNKIRPMANRMVLIAPALNQKDLMRFYFVRDSMKRKNPDVEIRWNNYKQYLNEKEFLADCERVGRMVRENYIEPGYFLEAKDFDFSNSFDSVKEKILHIHGENDILVPLASLNVEFPNRIIVLGGDHNLERPDFWDKWFFAAVDFLTK